MRDILRTYERAFGEAVNFQKSKIFFSANISLSLKTTVCNILEVNTPLDHGRYLGLPSLIGRSKK